MLHFQTICSTHISAIKNTTTYKGSEIRLTSQDGAFFSKHPDNSGPFTFHIPSSSFSLHRYGRWTRYDLTGSIDIFKTKVFPIRINASVGALFAARSFNKN